MDLQETFQHYREESTAVAQQISRLLAPNLDQSVSAEYRRRRREEMMALLNRQNAAARMLLVLDGRGTPRAIESRIIEPCSEAIGAAADAMGKGDDVAALDNEHRDAFLARDFAEAPDIPPATARDVELIAAEIVEYRTPAVSEATAGVQPAAALQEAAGEDPAAAMSQEVAEEHSAGAVPEDAANERSVWAMPEEAADEHPAAALPEETAGVDWAAPVPEERAEEHPTALVHEERGEDRLEGPHVETGEGDTYDWWNPNDAQIDTGLLPKMEVNGQQQVGDREQAALLKFDWSGLAERCAGAAALPDDPQILNDLSGAFNALFGCGELSLAAGDALSLAEQAFSDVDYAFQPQKDGGWVVSAGGCQCHSVHHLALAIYGAACLLLARRSNEIEERAGDLGELS